jgi:hypothetical protein
MKQQPSKVHSASGKNVSEHEIVLVGGTRGQSAGSICAIAVPKYSKFNTHTQFIFTM